MSTIAGACDVVVSVRIDEATLKALRARARADDRALSAWLRRQLRALADVEPEEARTDVVD